MMVFCPHCGHAWEPASENVTAEPKCPSCFASFLTPPPAARPAAAAILSAAHMPTAPTVRDRTTEEQSVYADGPVAVTTARVIIHGTTYGLRDIASVRVAVTHPRTGYASALMAVSSLVGLGGLIVMCFRGITGLVFLVLATLGCLSAWARFRTCQADYHIMLSSSAGETRVLSSKDASRVQKIVASINCAVALYH